MTHSTRQIIAIVGMTIGLIALVIDSADKGWTVLTTVGIACFAGAIASELLAIGRANRHS